MAALSIMIKPVSGACNMRCKYCFYTDVMAHRENGVYPKMRIDVLETLVRRIFRYADGPVSIAFQGGEPTLAGLEFYKAFVGFVRTYNVRGLPVSKSLQTNGYDISDELMQFFHDEQFLLGVSLDGCRATHDLMRIDAAQNPTFDRILHTLTRLKAFGVEYNILCVVNALVAEKAREVINALAPYGYLQFIPCLDPLDGSCTEYSLSKELYLNFLKESFDIYYTAFKAGRFISIRNFDNYIDILLGMPPENCAMGGRCGQYFLIESNGSVYPCDFYVLDELCLGNIIETPLNRIAKSSVGLQFREESFVLPECCKKCKWFGLCRNGCKRERNPETGLNRWCDCFTAFFDYAYPRMKELARLLSERQS